MYHKIDGPIIDDAEDLDSVVPMFSLVEYSSNGSEAIGCYGFILKINQLILMLIFLIIMTLILSNIGYIIRKH